MTTLTIIVLPFAYALGSAYWRMLCRWAPPDDERRKR